MNGWERQEAIEAIKQLKARYFRTMDQKDWLAFRQLFTDDATMDMSGSGGSVPKDAVIAGAERITRAVSKFLEGVQSIHHGHTPEIEIVSATTAAGVWAMEDRLWWPDRVTHGFGYYHETYVRAPEGWLMQTTKLVRLRLEDAGDRTGESSAGMEE